MNISISKKNYNRIKYTSQQWVEIDCWPVDKVTEDPEYFFDNLTYTQKRLINYFIAMSLNNKMVYPRQDTIASYLGITRSHCARLIKWMRDHNLIVSEYRHKLSCHYKLSSFFFNKSISSRLRHILSTFKILTFSIFSLTSFSTDATQYKKKLIKNLINPIVQQRTSESSMQFKQTYHGDKPVSEAIRNLKVINLTRAGQIKLSVFPDEAITDAANAYKYAKNVKEPFNWFYKLCFDYCKRNDIQPDWDFMHQLVDKYKISLTAPTVQKGPIKSVGDKTSRTAPFNASRDKASQVPPVNATSREFVLKTEWKGHVEVKSKEYDKDAHRSVLVKALMNKNFFFLDSMKYYPDDVRQDTIDLLAFDDSCYCDLLSTLCGWQVSCNHGGFSTII